MCTRCRARRRSAAEAVVLAVPPHLWLYGSHLKDVKKPLDRVRSFRFDIQQYSLHAIPTSAIPRRTSHNLLLRPSAAGLELALARRRSETASGRCSYDDVSSTPAYHCILRCEERRV
ncbi:hypothetical protein EVAR_56710_1 [Eumeta japonica]|uniref:Uncharacterized protein n=1 Tax=Eumeta variegata TaxID=151549 RepID=A0A4C1XXX0_EUMVA|nr:hypothetical protein EVAR_56710_1 [Eumeta japonica]